MVVPDEAEHRDRRIVVVDEVPPRTRRPAHVGAVCDWLQLGRAEGAEAELGHGLRC